MNDLRELRKATNAFGAFKKNALGIDTSLQDEVQQHYLRGAWGDGTLKSYNSGIVKLHRFASVKKIEKKELLPISPSLVKQFVVWASKKDVDVAKEDESVKSTTLKAYVAGIKAWHLFHEVEYPHHVDGATKTLLKATKMIEAKCNEIEKKRSPVQLADLVILLKTLPEQGETGLAMLCVALVAFWGTARLGELLSDNPKKQLPRWDDLEWNTDKSQVKIALQNAKTAKPGEIQHICLQRQDSLLDPVSLLEEWFALRPRKSSEELFVVHTADKKKRLGKQATINHLRSIWNTRRSKKKQMLHGHSFRIGGASLRWNLGADREEVKHCGRWASNAYLVYLRKFTDKELKETHQLLQQLRWKPTEKEPEQTDETESQRTSSEIGLSTRKGTTHLHPKLRRSKQESKSG